MPTTDSANGAVVLSWSGGKDSALTLWSLRRDDEQVRALLTTVTDEYDRISMHGVRVGLLRQQAAAIGLPLVEVRIPPSCPNELYEERMADALSSPKIRDCERYAFGDLFLEDVRKYREERLAASGKKGVWPCGDATHGCWHRSFSRRASGGWWCASTPPNSTGTFAGGS